MTRRSLVLALLFSLLSAPLVGADGLPVAKPEQVGLSSERLARIGAVLRADVERGRIPGAVVLVARKGRIAYLEAVGLRDKAAGAPMTPDAIFRLASMTKPMVTVAAMTLYEEGRLLPSDPVSRYIPAFSKLQVGVERVEPGTGKSVVYTVPPEREMTIQDLMRHTAGLTYGSRGSTAHYKNYPSSSTDAAAELTGAEFLNKLAELPLHFEPGSKWDYGFGLDVLGLAIEAVSGQKLGAFLEERIFKPLAMNDSGFVVPSHEVHRFAKGLPCDPLTGKPQRMRDSTKPHKFECGGGCGVSTAADYLRFALMLLNGGTLDGARILGRKTVEYMTSDHLVPAVDTTRLHEWPNINGYGFGLGVAVRRSAGAGGAVSSKGEYHWAGSTGTYFWPSDE